MLVDLHTHTLCSDGLLSPKALVEQAQAAGVTHLSITDHDSVCAYGQLASEHFPSLHLIAGIEFSTQWCGHNIHVVGLNIDLHSDAIITGVKAQQAARDERSIRIAHKLEKLGAENVLEGARRFAQGAGLSRPHFAAYLVDSGFCTSEKVAFKRYLGAGKIGDIKQVWASLSQVVDWIIEAGGIAVLAHPGQYRFTRTKLVELVDTFIQCGGRAIEVLSGQQRPVSTAYFADLATEKNLLASMGSDFHSPDISWIGLGMHKSLPEGCIPVWDSF